MSDNKRDSRYGNFAVGDKIRVVKWDGEELTEEGFIKGTKTKLGDVGVVTKLATFIEAQFAENKHMHFLADEIELVTE